MASDYDKLPEFRIKGINPTLHQEINNICDHLGTNVTSLLKPEIQKLANSYPAHMKLPKPKIKD